MQRSQIRAIQTFCFFRVSQYYVFVFGVNIVTGYVVQIQYNVLRRNDDWFVVRRGQDVVGRYYQRTRFQLGFQRQRYVNSYLVIIEVGVICRINQRVQLDSFIFDQYRFKCLDIQTVQSRCTVQQYRVFADNFVQDILNDSFFAFNYFFRSFNGGSKITQFQFVVDERFEQFQCYFFRQIVLMQTQVWIYGDYRTIGVVNTFIEQVLTETILFIFDYVG